MPTKVQNHPQPAGGPTHAQEQHRHEHDLGQDLLNKNLNKNVQHREALRLALGSILTPKRPYTPSTGSSASSGTASPAHPHHAHSPFLGAHSALNPSPPLEASASNPGLGNSPPPAEQAHHVSTHSHLHVPSRLAVSRANSSDSTGSDVKGEPVETETAVSVPVHAPQPTPIQSSSSSSSPTTSAVLAAGSSTGANAEQGSGSTTPNSRQKWIQTLQGKSAWDALIHGSFS